jgi:hypothetical protein
VDKFRGHDGGEKPGHGDTIFVFQWILREAIVTLEHRNGLLLNGKVH